MKKILISLGLIGALAAPCYAFSWAHLGLIALQRGPYLALAALVVISMFCKPKPGQDDDDSA
ncbi:MAG: hypothetical protein AB7S38_01830 [Vulcanimicrobiota bacterium]